jgi:hypothetical protein
MEKKKDLTLRFLQGYEGLSRFCDSAKKKDLESYCNTNWNIDWI